MKYYPQEINEYIQNNQMDKLIQIAESRHTLQFEQLRQLIKFSCVRTMGNHLAAAVLVTGPSSSGKTTFSKRLSKLMEKEGFCCNVISIDDYYLSREEIKRRQPNAASPDYETLDAFDVPYFQAQMTNFLKGNAIPLPSYNFKKGVREDSGRILKPSAKDLLIIEGIHAMNPKLTEGLAFARTIGVYICPFDGYVIPDKGEITSKDIRLMRRCLRDMVHRNTTIFNTLDMWPSVRAGEERYIKPMKQYADFFFNSSFEYEICILKTKLMSVLSTASQEEMEKLSHFLPLNLLSEFKDYNHARIPKGSIFNEFYC